jgi:hypothetical protein
MNELKLIQVIPLVDIQIIQETLTRLGIANRKQKVLYPTCYLYREPEGKFYICHFKEVFLLTKSSSYNNISDEDLARRNAIIFNLSNWKLIEVVDPTLIENHKPYIFVLPYEMKKEWRVLHKLNYRLLNNDVNDINKEGE